MEGPQDGASRRQADPHPSLGTQAPRKSILGAQGANAEFTLEDLVRPRLRRAPVAQASLLSPPSGVPPGRMETRLVTGFADRRPEAAWNLSGRAAYWRNIHSSSLTYTSNAGNELGPL
jgi:hypothetical protein